MKKDEKMKTDAQFRKLIFPLAPEEYATLEQNIIRDGCRDALVIWKEKDVLLDGHNRYEICKKHGIEYKTKTISLPDRAAAEDWIDNNQLGRRNLSPDMVRLLRGRLYNRTKTGGHGAGSAGQIDPQNTAEKIAKDSGVSPATVKRDGKFAEKVEANPELMEAVQNRVPVKQVMKEMRKTKQKADMAEAAEKNKSETKSWIITKAQDVVSCATLITDPPYGILTEKWEPGAGGIEDVTREWATRWDQCRADTLLIFFSQRFLWQGRQWFDESFLHYEFQQLLIWHYANNKSPQSRKGFKQTWEPIFFYRRKDCDRKVKVGDADWGQDLHDFDCHVAAVPQSNFNDAERKMHPAQKPVSVFRWLISAVTEPGELICDPFCGVGTSGVAAQQLKRKWHGIEIDSEYIKLAKERIAAYGSPIQ